MKIRLKQWFAPPTFADEDKTRAGRILYAILLITFGACALFIAIFALASPDPLGGIVITVVIALVALAALVMLQKGHVRGAAFFFIIVVWVTITPSHFYFGGIHSAGVFSQVVVIVMAGLLVGRRATILFAGLAILSILVLAHATVTGWLPPPLSPVTVYGLATNLIITVVAVTALLYVAMSGLYEALERARHNEHELGQRNHELAAIRHSLEQNVAELEQAQEQMRQYAARLEENNRELQDFAYTVSHDLQAPLRKIQAFGDRLQTTYAATLDERGQDYLRRMGNSASRMQTLIQDLLTFSRITTQARPFTSVNLHELIQDVLADLDTRLEETGGQVSVGPLPVIRADVTQMRQVFQNLIGNALKFHREDVSPVIRVQSESLWEGTAVPQGTAVITVRDNGIGFEPQYGERIFQVFQRLHTADEYEGTGIGLAVCKRIVERHDGRITATSTPSEGATFTIILPLTQG